MPPAPRPDPGAPPAPGSTAGGAAGGTVSGASGGAAGGAGAWTLVLPVKGGSAAKSRLVPAPGGERTRLALGLALALDCLDAVLRCPRVAAVVVVTADDAVRAAVAELAAAGAGPGVRVIPDPGAGLDAAAAAGLAGAGSGPRAVLLADVPCLVPEDLTAALDAAAGHGSAVVPDAGGTGTVLLALARDAARPTRFGPGSAAAHAADGAVRLDLALPRLRRDVDTPAELAQAVALGVGPRTRAALGG